MQKRPDQHRDVAGIESQTLSFPISNGVVIVHNELSVEQIADDGASPFIEVGEKSKAINRFSVNAP